MASSLRWCTAFMIPIQAGALSEIISDESLLGYLLINLLLFLLTFTKSHVRHYVHERGPGFSLRHDFYSTDFHSIAPNSYMITVCMVGRLKYFKCFKRKAVIRHLARSQISQCAFYGGRLHYSMISHGHETTLNSTI